MLLLRNVSTREDVRATVGDRPLDRNYAGRCMLYPGQDSCVPILLHVFVLQPHLLRDLPGKVVDGHVAGHHFNASNDLI